MNRVLMRNPNKIFLAIVLSESMHLFCCVLPTIFSVLSLLAGFGVMGALPASYVQFHDVLHNWELPIIGVSALLLILGWGLYVYSKKIDCHDTGCGHGPCTPKKDKSRFVLMAATMLFVVNILIYAGIHLDAFGFIEAVEHNHAH